MQPGAAGGCTDTIDLRGRTVIPGMIDNHFHVQLVGSRPGYETRTIETAFSIAEVQNVIRERAKGVPDGRIHHRRRRPAAAAVRREPAADARRARCRGASTSGLHPRRVQRAGRDQLAGQDVLRKQGRAGVRGRRDRGERADVGRARCAARELDARRHQADDAAGVRLLQQRWTDHRALRARIAGAWAGAVLRHDRSSAECRS